MKRKKRNTLNHPTLMIGRNMKEWGRNLLNPKTHSLNGGVECIIEKQRISLTIHGGISWKNLPHQKS
jgi:hypothetical protein